MPSNEVSLEGSEGGGQLLRSALSLSLVTQRPFVIHGFRAHRDAPGLRSGHLGSIRAALALAADGHAEGVEVGSGELRFNPGVVKGGSYELDVGGAGSVPLALQSLVYALALAGGGELVLRGGTHLAGGPSFHYLAWVWLPAMRALGLGVALHLRQAGFHSDASGEVRAEIAPWTQAPVRIEIPSRGNLGSAVVTAISAGVPLAAAQRQALAAAQALREHGILCDEEHLPLPAGRSAASALFVRLQFEHTAAGFTQLTERNQTPEDSALAVALQVERFMESAGAVDEHLADQLVVPAALLASGRLGDPATTLYTSAAVTPHLEVQLELARRFLSVQASCTASGEVLLAPAS